MCEPALAELTSARTDGEDVTGNAVLLRGRARKKRKKAMMLGMVTWANILLALGWFDWAELVGPDEGGARHGFSRDGEAYQGDEPHKTRRARENDRRLRRGLGNTFNENQRGYTVGEWLDP